MPKTVNHSKRPEYVALEIMKEGVAVTPTDIDAHVGTGKYSSKYVSFLKRDGFVIETKKDGRNVVSYTLVSRPAEDALPSHAFPRKAKVEKPKLAKAAAKKVVKAPAKKAVKAKKVAAKKSEGFVVPAKKSVSKPSKNLEQIVEEQENQTFAVDSAFDEMAEGFDSSVRDLA